GDQGAVGPERDPRRGGGPVQDPGHDPRGVPRPPPRRPPPLRPGPLFGVVGRTGSRRRRLAGDYRHFVRGSMTSESIRSLYRAIVTSIVSISSSERSLGTRPSASSFVCVGL